MQTHTLCFNSIFPGEPGLGKLDAKWHNNLYDVPQQCVMKVALAVLKKTSSFTHRTRCWKVMENTLWKVLENPGKLPEMFCMNPGDQLPRRQFACSLCVIVLYLVHGGCTSIP